MNNDRNGDGELNLPPVVNLAVVRRNSFDDYEYEERLVRAGVKEGRTWLFGAENAENNNYQLTRLRSGMARRGVGLTEVRSMIERGVSVGGKGPTYAFETLSRMYATNDRSTAGGLTVGSRKR